MKCTAVPKSISTTILVFIVSLCFATAGAAFAPAAWAQRGSSGGHVGGGSHASGAGHSRGGQAFGFGGGLKGSANSGGNSGAAVSNTSGGHSAGIHSFFRWFHGGSEGTHGKTASGEPTEQRGYTREVFVGPQKGAVTSRESRTESADSHEGVEASFGSVTAQMDVNAPRMILMSVGPANGESTLNARPFAADNYLWEEPSAGGSGQWSGAGFGAQLTAQNGRPGYAPPPQAQAPRPITIPQVPRPVAPVQPVQAPRPMYVPPPGARPIGQTPITPDRPIGIPQVPQPPKPILVPPPIHVRQPIGLPIVGEHPVHPLFAPPRLPIPAVPPAMHFPLALPPLGRPVEIRPRPPEFHAVPPPSKAPLFHPVLTPPRHIPFGSEAPPGRMRFGPPLRTRNGGPFAGMTPQPPLRFEAFPCINTITHCGLILNGGFDGDFDFDDGFFFGFPFGFPPFGFIGLGPNCFWNGIFEPCAFTPWGFAAFQAWGPNGWGWSYLGLGNGFFYSEPQPPPAPPWNSTETTPELNLQYFTNEWYLPAPYSELNAPEAGAGTQSEQGEQKSVVTEIVTTDGIVFGVTSYWMQDNQLCYVTTYNIKNCIPMSRVDLQKTVDMNYKLGVKFVLSPQPPAKKDSDQ